MRIKITFTNEMLGTKAADPEVFANFIAMKHPSGTPQHDELEMPGSREERGTTVFHRDGDGNPIIWDYQIKGFLKAACGALRKADGTKSKELKAYKAIIDGLVFVYPRFITIILPEGVAIGICERPLRADTMQGPRVSVCRSETVPAGSFIEVGIKTLAKHLDPLVREWLDYGRYNGLGQWRNSGKGQFFWETLEE